MIVPPDAGMVLAFHIVIPAGDFGKERYDKLRHMLHHRKLPDRLEIAEVSCGSVRAARSNLGSNVPPPEEGGGFGLGANYYASEPRLVL